MGCYVYACHEGSVSVLVEADFTHINGIVIDNIILSLLRICEQILLIELAFVVCEVDHVFWQQIKY